MEIEQRTWFFNRVLLKSKILDPGTKLQARELDPVHHKHPMRYDLTVRPDGLGVQMWLVNPDVLVNTLVLKGTEMEGFSISSKVPGITHSFKCRP